MPDPAACSIVNIESGNLDNGIEFNEAAFRHGVTEADIRCAFGHRIFDHPVEGEEYKHLLIGFDKNANLLEILYNIIGERHINVFHAMKCRKSWRVLAEGGGQPVPGFGG